MVTLTPRQKTARRKGASYSYFAQFDHPDGAVNVFWGYGAVYATYKGETRKYRGMAGLVQIEGLEDTTDVSLQEIGIQIMQVQNSDIQHLMDTDIEGSEMKLFKGYFDRQHQVIDDLIFLKKYPIQYHTITTGADGNYYTIWGNPGLVELLTPHRTLYQDSYQRAVFPDDSGLSEVSGL